MSATLRLAISGVRRRGLGQVVVLVLVTGLASAAVVAGLASRTSTADLVDAAYERAGRPDLVLYGTADALRAAAADPEIAAASPPAVRADGETLVDGDPVTVVVTAVDPATPAGVGAPQLVDGRWPVATGEVVVERSVAVEGVVAVGRTVDVTTDNGPVQMRVVGTAIELSDCFYTNEQCDPLRFFGREDLVGSMEPPGAFPRGYVASYRLVHPERAAAVGARLLRDNGPAAVFGQNSWPDTRGDILIIGEVFGAMVGGFGAFLLASACFVVAGATAARLVARRRSLGLLRAIGFRPAQLAASVLVEHLAIGAVGVLGGWVAGSLIAPQLSDVDKVLDTSTSAFELPSLITAVVLVEAFLAAAVILPAWRAGRQPATEVLRDIPPSPSGGRIVAAVARRLGAGPSLVAGLRRSVARPVRASLAAAAVLVAAVGVIMTAGFIGSVEASVDDTARIGEPWDAFFFTSHPQDEIAAVLDGTPEVAAWHTERETMGTADLAGYSTRVIGGDPAGVDYRVQEGRRLEHGGEALVGYGFLQETGLSVGDRFQLDVDGSSYDLEIAGWHVNTADAGKIVLIREETLAAGALGDQLPTFRVVAAEGVDRSELATALRERLGDRAAVIAGDPDDAGLGSITSTLMGFAVLLGFVAAANLAAVTMAATRERARALGVLRTIGCTTRQLVAQSAAGAGLLGLAAGVVGAPLGLIIFRLLSDAIGRGVGAGPGLAESPSRWFVAAVIPAAVLVSAAAGAVASIGLARRPAAELVRYE